MKGRSGRKRDKVRMRKGIESENMEREYIMYM